MTQFGFVFDQSRCTGCQVCALACKSYNGLPAGPLKYLRIYQYEKGVFPNVRLHIQWVPCYHCERPVCVDSCPAEAVAKETDYGAVLVDGEKCTGCRVCYDECPYGAPVFESDDVGAKACKCNMCIDRLRRGDLPACVQACPTRCLDFGPLNDLEKKYGNNRSLEDLPDSSITMPGIIFKPRREKRQIIPYDSEKALNLFMKRDPLPHVFKSRQDVTDIPEGMVGRSRLTIKHGSVEEMISCTRNDEG